MRARNLRESTRAAMRLTGWLLARDLQEIPDAEWAPRAKVVLEGIDQLDVVGDEDTDRRVEGLGKASGPEWLYLAEEGFFDGTDYIGHVLYHFEAGGYSGPAFVRNLLLAIDSADEDNRWALAAGHPEYVGLWRAVAQMPDGKARLIAVLDRK